MEAHPDDRAAIALVATIDELFAIDAQAQKQNLTVIERDQSWNRSRANRNGQRPDSSKEDACFSLPGLNHRLAAGPFLDLAINDSASDEPPREASG